MLASTIKNAYSAYRRMLKAVIANASGMPADIVGLIEGYGAMTPCEHMIFVLNPTSWHNTIGTRFVVKQIGGPHIKDIYWPEILLNICSPGPILMLWAVTWHGRSASHGYAMSDALALSDADWHNRITMLVDRVISPTHTEPQIWDVTHTIDELAKWYMSRPVYQRQRWE